MLTIVCSIQYTRLCNLCMNIIPIHHIYYSHIYITHIYTSYTPYFQYTHTYVCIYIHTDDQLLAQEGVEDLSNEELELALFRRGYNPEGADIDLKQHLANWYQSNLSKHCRESNPIPVSLLVHATALPEKFVPLPYPRSKGVESSVNSSNNSSVVDLDV